VSSFGRGPFDSQSATAALDLAATVGRTAGARRCFTSYDSCPKSKDELRKEMALAQKVQEEALKLA
jgi:hypothetical protein